MTAWKYRVKLSQGSLLLLHLAAVGHVWRGKKREWVASTQRNKRNVDMRICKLIDQGMLQATYESSFPELTDLGRQYLRDHPLGEVLKTVLR